MNYRSYLRGFFIGCLIFAAAVVVLFFLSSDFRAKQAGRGWAPTLIKAKSEAIQRAQSPKAVIVSGSNGLFGIAAGQLSEYLSIPVYNAACYGALTWTYADYYALRHLKAGDYAILPLELAYYNRTDRLNSETVMTAHAIGLDFFRSLPLEEKISYLRLLSPKFVRQQMENRFLGQRTRTFKYSTYPLQPNGDIDTSKAVLTPEQAEKEASASLPSTPDDRALDAICRTVRSLEARGVHAVFTQQNSYVAEKNRPNFEAFMGKVAEKLQQCGATFVSVPSHGLLPLDAMLDTHLHPNAAGRTKRTAELGPALCRAGLPCRSDIPADAADAD